MKAAALMLTALSAASAALLPTLFRGSACAPLRCAPPCMQTGAKAFGMETINLMPGPTFIVGVRIKRNKYKTLENSWTIDDSSTIVYGGR